MRQGHLSGAAVGLLALAVAVGVGVGGCGSSGPHTRRDVLAHFPDLGYHRVAPRLPPGLTRDAVVAVALTNHGYVRPATMQLASDTTLSDARWTGWGSATANAHGTATVQLCTSSCGAGHRERYPATVRFSGIRTCGTVRYYEHARLTLSTERGPRPWGAFLQVPCG